MHNGLDDLSGLDILLGTCNSALMNGVRTSFFNGLRTGGAA
jgi:hypothetical protein